MSLGDRALRADEVFLLAMASLGGAKTIDWLGQKLAGLSPAGLPGLLVLSGLLFWGLIREYQRERQR